MSCGLLTDGTPESSETMAAQVKKTRFKSIENAERRIRLLEQRIRDYEEICTCKTDALRLLAKLAATGPAFFNPLEAAAAEKIRDELLYSMRMRPDGTFIN